MLEQAPKLSFPPPSVAFYGAVSGALVAE
jgi:hypothetical protein